MANGTLEHASLGEAPAAALIDARQQEAAGPLGLSMTAWFKIVVVAALMAATFRFNLLRLWLKTNPFNGEPNWGHAVCIPVIGLYYLYINREELLSAVVKPVLPGKPDKFRLISTSAMILVGLATAFVVGRMLPGVLGSIAIGGGAAMAACGVLALLLNWGLGTAVFGLAFFAYGIYPGQNDYVKDLGMIITLFGIVLTLCGWQVMRIAWFPIAFLVCALPWPGLVYSWVAGPLQALAANVAVAVLNLVGIQSYCVGTKIVMGPRTLNVAEACAGLRSLMTFISVAAAVSFLSARPLWQKLFITAMAVPIAIFCNVMRVTGQGIIDRLFGAEWSENFAHQFVGLIMLIPAFFLILGIGWLLDQIFVDEVDDTDAAAAAAGAEKAEQIMRAAAGNGHVVGVQTAPTLAAPAVVAAATPAAAPRPAPVTVPIPPAATSVLSTGTPVKKPEPMVVAIPQSRAVRGAAAVKPPSTPQPTKPAPAVNPKEGA